MSVHIHIDTVGGISGDMFIASMLDAYPEFGEPVREQLHAADILDHVGFKHTQELVNGMAAAFVEFPALTSAPRPTHHYKHIKDRLEKSTLNRAVLKHTIAIFDLLAAAEATVHGVAIEDVHFHEIADWDSQADIVAAAAIIEHVNAQSWSCSTLPIGCGSIQTEHGRLPVPAPATTQLLSGFTMHDDGESGERVTPTGAAILAYLIDPKQLAERPNGRLQNTGTGCGKKRFKTVPNIARIMAFDIANNDMPTNNSYLLNDQVGVIGFDIDDMSPEELSIGIDHLRATAGVIDVNHHTRVGKKNRSLFSVQILCTPESVDHVIEACFLQTSTIGLRTSTTSRTILRRRNDAVISQGTTHAVKQSVRPDGVSTNKIESDGLATYSTLVERRAIANDVEQKVSTVDE